MIRIIAGGKKSSGWVAEGVAEYEKRLRKPFDVKWETYDEVKLEALLGKWPFVSGRDYVIVADERGENWSSPEFAATCEKAFNGGREVVIIIGGAYGVSSEVRERADAVWSFSRLVFPHMLMRVMMAEQIYRAQEISRGGKYHHE
ncbi:23S rRNA (pseudouridine(1915)-N(3))-methyltransferase RlmH [Candidatus Saccharibacteria bacterium]|nr:23S rRNA (pseudouridine(1915)-N(3))-methyltransferase RlmH [Candidatus Saccharibacteria bacterium]